MRKYKFLFITTTIVLVIFVFNNCRSTKKVNLTIMSYNILHGVGLDGKYDLSRAAKIIKTQSPNLCALQEVDYFCRRSDSIDQVNYLVQQTSMKGTFGKFMDYQNGQYGMATLSTNPILTTQILALPDGKYEPRSTIIQEIQIADGYTILFANVHFDWISEKEGSINRLKQAKVLMNYLNASDKACVIAGDFNCTPNSETMQYFINQGFNFTNKGEDNLSFQGKIPVEIDHVIYRNTKHIQFHEQNVDLLNEPIVSDHRPLVVEFSVILK